MKTSFIIENNAVKNVTVPNNHFTILLIKQFAVKVEDGLDFIFNSVALYTL